LVRNVFDHMGVGIPGFGISGVPLEEHAPHRAMAPTCAKGPRAPTRICRISADVAPYGARSRPSGENICSGKPWDFPTMKIRPLVLSVSGGLTEMNMKSEGANRAGTSESTRGIFGFVLNAVSVWPLGIVPATDRLRRRRFDYSGSACPERSEGSSPPHGAETTPVLGTSKALPFRHEGGGG